MSNTRVLIIGSGLLGSRLNQVLPTFGFNTRITLRSHNKNVSDVKKWTNTKIVKDHNGYVCDNLTDYQQVVTDFGPQYIINTIPQPPKELLEYLLSVNNCFKIDFSSPASDFAKSPPNKCPPGSYPGDKLIIEKMVNQRAIKFGDALVLQIGFIPEISSIDNVPIIAGLSFDTMLYCNLLTGFYDDDIKRLDNNDTNNAILQTALKKYDVSKGYTCTDTASICNFLSSLMSGKIVFPDHLLGRTLALHSSQVWLRSEIIKALSDPEYLNNGNPLPEFYGQKSVDKITKPVKEFQQAFGKLGYTVEATDVYNAISNTGTLFKDSKNRDLMIQLAIDKIKN